ncbi:unconventional myosin-Ic-like [Anabas testudineus]|uniref:unconventional myosin-Ic-like n=1 Tax=Anabas testudineus TaxID=64144 RepID=UPI000E46475D|nr:unconventional myosin-Ic-like [Anabas testudineus]
MVHHEHIKYSVPVVKYDRNGFRPRLRQLIFTQEAAYLVEEVKIKQRIDYSSLKGEEDINLKVLQMVHHEHIKYSVPVVKYDRNGFRPHLRQLIFTQEAAYLVEEAKIKQRIDYSSLKGEEDINLKVLQMVHHEHIKYSVPVVKYDRKGLGLVSGNSSSPKKLPTWSRRPRSSRG